MSVKKGAKIRKKRRESKWTWIEQATFHSRIFTFSHPSTVISRCRNSFEATVAQLHSTPHSSFYPVNKNVFNFPLLFFPFFLFHFSPTLHPRCCCFCRLRSEFSLYETWQSSLAVSRSSQEDARICGRRRSAGGREREISINENVFLGQYCALFFCSFFPPSLPFFRLLNIVHVSLHTPWAWAAQSQTHDEREILEKIKKRRKAAARWERKKQTSEGK